VQFGLCSLVCVILGRSDQMNKTERKTNE